jgi:hypothetical protein
VRDPDWRTAAYRSGVMVSAVDVDIVEVESERYDLRAYRGGEDEGERECERGEETADSYGSRPSEKEDAGVWKEAKSVCSELTVTLGVRLKRERDLYECLGWCAWRSIDGVRGGIMTVGVVEPSPSATPAS